MNIRSIAAAFALAAGVVGVTSASEDEWAAWGGYLRMWPDNPGQFAFVDAQTRASADAIAAAEKQVEDLFQIKYVKTRGAAPALSDVPGELKKLGAKGGIWFIDNPSLPITIAATENGWGFLNVSALVADNPSSELLESRLVKVLNRLFASIHGGIESMTMPGCVTKPAHGVKGIDELTCLQLSPEAYGKISGHLHRAGYKTVRSGSYYDACEEGWAPKPTNAVQKAIWDKVHALPTEPIKIKPEAKKVKE